MDFEQDFESSGDLDTSSTSDSESTVSDTDSSSSVEDRSDSTAGDDWMDDSDSSVDDVEVKTADALASKLKDLVDADAIENVYVEVPKVNLETIVASNEEVHQVIDQSWAEQQVKYDNHRKNSEYRELLDLYPENLFEEVDSEFHKFRNDAKKEVSYLVKEFESRKSASAYARSSTSRTGVLDTTKLQTYRFNEDLFKRVTVLPDGKNHGLIFILDWSGSMQYVLQDTLKQLYNLIWFCKKVQIPFEVYAFTSEFRKRVAQEQTGEYSPEIEQHYKPKEGLLVVEDDFTLMNLFTSKVNSTHLQIQMINIWRLAHCFSDRFHVRYQYPQPLVLSGTPLNESLISLFEILPQFQKDTGVEKVQCIVLTDGEANTVPYHKEIQRHWEPEPFMGHRGVNPHYTFLRDRKIGKTYKFGYQWHQFTDIILRNLKDRFPSTNFIGIRVLGKRDASQFMRMHNASEKVHSDWRKNRSFSITTSGYDAYFGLSSTALAQDVEFDVDCGATKAKIKSAFVKSLKTKKLNKKILGEFISLVA